MAYTKLATLVANVTTAAAAWGNSVMSEIKGAAEGIPLHDVDVVIAWSGFTPTSVTYTDNDADASYDVDCVSTITWSGFQPTQIAHVFDKLSVTQTEALTWSGFQCTAITRTLS